MLDTAVIRTMRPPFLLLTPACLLLGIASAHVVEPSLDAVRLVLVLVGALAAHISVNMLNEYQDFRSGLDLVTEKTSFSGGSGGLPEHPQSAPAVLFLGSLALVVTLCIGVYFISLVGQQLLPVGLLGALIVVTYTQWINRSPWLCLLTPGFGFGPLMVVGTQLALTGEVTRLAVLLSLVPFFLVNNVLLLNQYPDIAADRSVGRRTFPIVYGPASSTQVYGVFALAAFVLIALMVATGQVPALGLVALLPMVSAWHAFRGGRDLGDNVSSKPSHLAAGVATALSTPVLLGLAILWG